MRSIWTICKKELYITFASPIFYAVGFIFLLCSGYFLYSSTAYFSYLSYQAQLNPILSERLNLTAMVISPFFGDLSVVLLLIIPMLSMRLYSEERRSGTIELLFTYPLKDFEILFGKFLSTFILICVILLFTLPGVLILCVFGNVERNILFSGYLGLLLLASSFISVGLFTSSLTENQIVAAVLSFGLLLLLFVIGWAQRIAPPSIAPIFLHLSIVGHLEAFTEGLIDTRDAAFYLIFSAFWLFLTLKFLDISFWRR